MPFSGANLKITISTGLLWRDFSRTSCCVLVLGSQFFVLRWAVLELRLRDFKCSIGTPELSMASINRVEDLTCWRLGMSLAKEAYTTTSGARFRQDPALISQIRRSSISIPSNIAEGFGRSSSKDFAHFVDIARGSTFELSTLLQLAMELGYLSEAEHAALVASLRILIPKLTSFAKYLRSAKAPYR